MEDNNNKSNIFTSLPAEIISHVFEYTAQDPVSFQDHSRVMLVDKFMLKEIRRNRNLFKQKLSLGTKIEELQKNLKSLYYNDELQIEDLRSELRKCFDQYFFPRFLPKKFLASCKRCKTRTTPLLYIPKRGNHPLSSRRIEWCSDNNVLVLFTYTVLYTHRLREEGRDSTSFQILTLDEAIETIVQTKIHNIKAR